MRYSTLEAGIYIVYEMIKTYKKNDKSKSLNAMPSLLNNVNICKHLLRYF